MWKFNNMEITIWKAKIYSQEAYQNWSTCEEMSWKQNYARFWRNDKGNWVTHTICLRYFMDQMSKKETGNKETNITVYKTQPDSKMNKT